MGGGDTVELIGRLHWSASRDREGYREYTITHLVRGELTEGPAEAMQTPGLPVVGDSWAVEGDSDEWATCKLDAKVDQHQIQNEANNYWTVEQKFSSKSDNKKCKDEQIDDPLLQPPKVSGSFVKYQEEASFDINGNAILTSSFENVKGPQVEFDATRYSVIIEQNVAALDLPTVVSLKDHVNDSTLWGMPARCVKLSDFSFEVKYYGHCYQYYTRKFTFEIRDQYVGVAGDDRGGFDREILDEGHKALNGHWGLPPLESEDAWILDDIQGVPPDPTNPACYSQYKDRRGENGTVILDGHGLPITVSTFVPGSIFVQKYEAGNLLLLGIPTVL